MIPPSWPQYLNSQKDCKLDLLDTAFLITSFVTLFVIIDPVGLTPVFVTLTQGMPNQQRRNIGLRATLVAAVILCIFCLFGESVLEFVGISMPAFQISGGILLFLIALDMLFERRTKRRKSQSEEDDQSDDISVFPLAIPLFGRSWINHFYYPDSQHNSWVAGSRTCHTGNARGDRYSLCNVSDRASA